MQTGSRLAAVPRADGAPAPCSDQLRLEDAFVSHCHLAYAPSVQAVPAPGVTRSFTTCALDPQFKGTLTGWGVHKTSRRPLPVHGAWWDNLKLMPTTEGGRGDTAALGDPGSRGGG